VKIIKARVKMSSLYAQRAVFHVGEELESFAKSVTLSFKIYNKKVSTNRISEHAYILSRSFQNSYDTKVENT